MVVAPTTAVAGSTGQTLTFTYTASVQLTEGALAVFCLYMFIVHSATTAKPFFDVRLFKAQTYVVSTIIMALLFIVYYGSMVLTPWIAGK